MKRILLLGALGAALLLPTALFATTASAGPDEPVARDGAGRAGRGEHRRHRRMQVHMARHRLQRLVGELNLSDAQKTLVKDARVESQGARDALRAEVKGLRGEARDGERTPEARQALREKVKAARTRAADTLAPKAQSILDTLTAEQRAVLEKRAAARGETLDDAKLLRLFERLLLAPDRHARRR